MIDFGKYNEQSSPWGMIRGWYYDGEASRPFHQLDNKVLSRSLHCYITVDETEADSEEEIPLGASKTKGLPHLPASIEWPDNTLFLAQFNLADLKPHDIQQQLPAEGILYFFFSPNDSECEVFFYEGPTDQLERREYPEEGFPDMEHYFEDYAETRNAVNFHRGAKIAIHEFPPLIPAEMKADLEKILGCELSKNGYGDDMFGQPSYWQGENELFDDEQHDEEGDIMLFQYEFGEGNVHFWISREELANRDFSKVYLDYSGT
ncbi:YwqG family protein [Paraflavitalea sp. CAU 1676]|uniref:YwqG family protein n=1 Tax=Paraflavitalea sp. CAU 1676 TaxID=3032598 RepID=UPI0023DC063F|nr:YwqG family protein [Paraflavitalea sp. CAU 1676]MDF2192002.1 YwqG family protein [Paraflavitalea sp. CAU 1676]